MASVPPATSDTAAASSSASAMYSTPTKRTAVDVRTGKARPAGASPAYSSRRHSLYGIEDRVVIDPGSRVWKVGFSGEPDPRAVFWSQDRTDRDAGRAEMFGLDLSHLAGAVSRSEGRRMVASRILRRLREIFHKHLLTDPKARKMIIVESTFLPTFIKEDIARVLFDNLNVPSVSFTSGALLSLAAVGRVTGLVVDCGWLETTVTPVAYSRPLHHLARSTPLAGQSLHRRLLALLSLCTYTAFDSPSTLIPTHILTDAFVERVLTESCFVGGVVIPTNANQAPPPASNEVQIDEEGTMEQVQKLKARYAENSTAKDVEFSVGEGVVIVPGWIRERAAEILFDETDSDAPSVPQLVLSTLLKAPIDLRAPLASSILIVGGTSSLPGFIPRLRISLLRHLLSPPEFSPITPTAPVIPPHSGPQSSAQTWRARQREPYKVLYGLGSTLAILNDPSPPVGSGGGKAPRWAPSLTAWVGGSLAGALKTSGPELSREDYDTRVSDALARGETYVAHLEALEANDSDEAQVRAAVGVSIDELLPGMALGGGGGSGDKRKRGWGEAAVLGDWSTGVSVG